jgi:phage shock protein C
MWRRDYVWPVILIVLGIFFLLNNLHVFDRIPGDLIWPIALIALGVFLILRRTRP